VRHLSVQRALERDEFTVMPTAVAVSLAIYGLLLGAGTIALLLGGGRLTVGLFSSL
jgi:hypothetical protein